MKTHAIYLIAGVLISISSSNLFSQNYDWAYGMGSSGAEQARHAFTDASGNLYVVGTVTTSTDIDPGPATTNVGGAGNEDGFIAKYNSGGVLQWGFGFGGILADQAKAVYADASYVYVTGSYRGSVNFDPAFSTAGSLTNNGQSDIFVAKYTVAGAFVWAKGVGGTLADEGAAITADGSGNVYVTGFYQDVNVDFDPGPNTALRSASIFDIFILKLNTLGSFGFATCIGGTGSDKGNGIAVDGSGNVYVTGQFFNVVDFNPGAANYEITDVAGGGAAFVAQYNSSGDFGWAFDIEGFGPDQGNAILTDGLGNIFVAGVYQGVDVDFDPGAGTQLRSSASSSLDFFLAKYSSSGSYLFVNSIGGQNAEKLSAMAKDNSNNIYLTGSFNGTVDFNPGTGVNNITSSNDDVFIAKYTNNGTYGFALGLGGTSAEQGLGVGVSNSNSIYVAGYFQSTADFDPGTGTKNLTANAGFDIFIAKYCIPPSIYSQPDNQTACISNSTTFTVAASGPDLTYQWKKGVNNIINGGRISGATSASLTISNIVAGDAGNYSVEVSNGCSPSVISNSVSLTVNTYTGVLSQADHSIKIYPNPSVGVFTIDISGMEENDVQVNISDAKGVKIWSGSYAHINGDIKEDIDLENLEAGIYFLRIENGENILVKKIVLNK